MMTRFMDDAMNLKLIAIIISLAILIISILTYYHSYNLATGNKIVTQPTNTDTSQYQNGEQIPFHYIPPILKNTTYIICYNETSDPLCDNMIYMVTGVLP